MTTWNSIRLRNDDIDTTVSVFDLILTQSREPYEYFSEYSSVLFWIRNSDAADTRENDRSYSIGKR